MLTQRDRVREHLRRSSGESESIEVMPYKRNGEFEWEYPAHVISVLNGESFLADIDLGFNVHVHAVVVAEGIDADPLTTANGLAARKEAQRLLKDADVMVRTRRLTSSARTLAVVAEVAYNPWFEARSEQGSFEAAMLASGHVRKRVGAASS